MKRFIAAVVASLLVLSLAACGSTPAKPKLYIEKAQLTKQEEDIAGLMGANMNQRIYDFVLDSSVKSMQVNTYKLANGSWDLVAGGGGQQFTDTKGRMALDFDRLPDGLRVALHSEHYGGNSRYLADATAYYVGMGTLTTALDTPTEVIYEQEIPLVLQIVSAVDSGTVVSGDLDSFFTPEDIATDSYEYVYAITILFSQKTVSELAG